MPTKKTRKKNTKEYWWGLEDEVFAKFDTLEELVDDMEKSLEEGGADAEYSEEQGNWIIEVKRLPFVAKMVKQVKIL